MATTANHSGAYEGADRRENDMAIQFYCQRGEPCPALDKFEATTEIRLCALTEKIDKLANAANKLMMAVAGGSVGIIIGLITLVYQLSMKGK